MGNDMKLALVAEDDPFIRRYIKLLLQECGFTVHETGSRKDAERIADSFQFDLAVLDGMLPDGSGIGLADKIDCQVIFVSGLVDQYNRKAMWSRGTLYQKPIDASFIDCVKGVYNGL